MKTKMLIAFLICTVSASQTAFTTVRHQPTNDEPPHLDMARTSGNNAHVLADLLAQVTPAVPQGPRDLLQAYESAMASIAGRLSTDLGTISNAVQTGQITRERGEYISGERYVVAMMQFQLFSALHEMLEADLARTPSVRTVPTPPPAGETVLGAMPFSSLQLSSSLVEYLGLSPTQVRSIQRLMDEERPATETLMHELRTISEELRAAIQHGENNDNGVATKRLATTQARLLKQLMKSNSRLQQRINDVLDSQQRKKLDYFKRTSEVTVGEAN
jgi:Spy/CpxP family protein refolding chaperone